MLKCGEGPLLRVQGVSVDLRREGELHRVVDAATFSFEAGEVVDLLGASGSGKSTLLRACARMVARAEGELFLCGRPASDFSPREWRAQVCLVPQKPALVPGSVRDNLLAPWALTVRKGVERPTDERMCELLAAAGLDDVSLARDVSQLSGGQAARVALARVFLARPRVMLMDEVDAALDAESSAAVSVLTQRFAHEGGACLRIRHREPDGLASFALSMVDGRLSSREAHPSSAEGFANGSGCGCDAPAPKGKGVRHDGRRR